jgi:hypothetical protein
VKINYNKRSCTEEKKKQNSSSISTLFIGKEPGPLHGLSGPDGKAIIGNEEEEEEEKKYVGRLLGCARG